MSLGYIELNSSPYSLRNTFTPICIFIKILSLEYNHRSYYRSNCPNSTTVCEGYITLETKFTDFKNSTHVYCMKFFKNLDNPLKTLWISDISGHSTIRSCLYNHGYMSHDHAPLPSSSNIVTLQSCSYGMPYLQYSNKSRSCNPSSPIITPVSYHKIEQTMSLSKWITCSVLTFWWILHIVGNSKRLCAVLHSSWL